MNNVSSSNVIVTHPPSQTQPGLLATAVPHSIPAKPRKVCTLSLMTVNVVVCAYFINPRRACARVTVVVCLSVCLSVYPSVPALAASASVETSKQRYSRVSLRLFLDSYVWSFEKTFRSKVMAWKSQYANKLELTVSRFRAVSGPTKRSSYVKGNWWVECCFRG